MFTLPFQITLAEFLVAYFAFAAAGCVVLAFFGLTPYGRSLVNNVLARMKQ